jgi:hypothetical protein
MSPRLATTRLIKVRGERRWKAVPAYVRRKCTPDEVAQLFHQLEHELARSADPASDALTRYQAQSAASLVLATLVLRAWDYETVPPLDPKNTLGALPDLFGPEGREPAKMFLSHHRKSRRSQHWTTRQAVLAKEIRELSHEVDLFRKSVLEWLEAARRNLLPSRPRATETTGPDQMMLF